MNRKLTVSEVAKMLNVSAHTIRYYDKEGLISVEKNEDNKYRIFDMKSVTHLANIMLLRDCGIPIKDIKELYQNFKVDDYEKLLNQSMIQLDEQMNRIINQKKVVKQALKHLSEADEEISVQRYENTYLQYICELDYDSENESLDIYDMVIKKGIKDIVYKDIYYVLNQDKMQMYFEVEASVEDENILVINQGLYMENSITVELDDDVEQAINKMYTYGDELQLEMDEVVFMNCFDVRVALRFIMTLIC
jgi:DNA-binding transcriptional MerR regulator